MDTILGILSGESYNGIHVLTDLSVCVKYTNKLSDAFARETIGVKILILILMSTNLVITSFCGITLVLLNHGIDRTTDADSTFRRISTRKE